MEKSCRSATWPCLLITGSPFINVLTMGDCIYCFRPLDHVIFVCDCVPIYHESIMDDYTVLGRRAMSSLYGTGYYVLIMGDYYVGPRSQERI